MLEEESILMKVIQIIHLAIPAITGVAVLMTETTRYKFEGVTTRIANGSLLGIIASIVGLPLTMTGIVTLIGIPLVQAGIFLVFMSRIRGLGGIKGPCPYRGTEIPSNSKTLRVTCKAFKNFLESAFIGSITHTERQSFIKCWLTMIPNENFVKDDGL